MSATCPHCDGHLDDWGQPIAPNMPSGAAGNSLSAEQSAPKVTTPGTGVQALRNDSQAREGK